jgi:1-acyl-sn-glycerol-3-phosphate acyltransferase
VLYRATQLIGYPLLRGYFRPEVTGREFVPRSGPAIMAANHLSAADQVVTPISAHRQVVYFAKAEYFTTPGIRGRAMAAFFNGMRHVPVERMDTRAAAASIDIGVAVLNRGEALGIFPEGTRSPDGRLYKFRTGVARLALRTGAPVVPVGLIGTREVQPPGRRMWHRAAVAVHYGAPMNFGDRADEERSSRALREITDTIRVAVEQLTCQEYVPAYASSVRGVNGAAS